MKSNSLLIQTSYGRTRWSVKRGRCKILPQSGRFGEISSPRRARFPHANQFQNLNLRSADPKVHQPMMLQSSITERFTIPPRYRGQKTFSVSNKCVEPWVNY